MAAIEIIRVSFNLTVSVPMEQLQHEMGELVSNIGPSLAEQVQLYVDTEKLGYYPPLQYLQDQEALDPNLLSAAEHIATMVGELVRHHIRTQLREAFSNVEFEKIQCVAFSMPRVRPTDSDAFDALARHYSPNVVRLNLITASIERGGINRQGYERLAAHKLKRWLDEEFETVEIGDARVIDT